MDLAPFGWINPCGYEGLQTVQLAGYGIRTSVEASGEALLAHLERLLPPVRPKAPTDS
jgi:lipoyl(octanoyl) transferase